MSCQRGQVRGRASMAAAEFSSHVIPTLACAMAWDLWLRNIIVIRLIMKTRHCISGCVEPSFDSVEMLCINYVESSISMKSIFDFRTLMYHPSFTLNDNTLAPCRHGGQGSAIPYALGTHSCRRFASSRGGTSLPRAERGGSDPFMTD